MARTLVIIDMQPNGFTTAQNENVVRNILKEIKLARRRFAGIILVEYVGYGLTDIRIRHALNGYVRASTIHKRNDDGGAQVVKIAKQRDYDLSCWRVCGVNVAHCVNATVTTMRELLDPETKIEVKKKACNCVWNNIEESFNWLLSYNGVAVKTV
jgi:nicotinamidase-related amidase